MARIRSLKPEFFTSEQIVSVSIPARYLFQGMWVFGDDDGYISASPLQLKMRIFPGDDVDVKPLLGELVDNGLVVFVEADQGGVYWTPSFRNHQKPKYPTPTKFTVDGVSLVEHSPSIPPILPQGFGSTSLREERRVEESRGGEGRVEEKSSSSEVAVAPVRPEIDYLLDLLDSEIAKNGSRIPTRNKANVDAARLLVDRDGRSVQQVEAAIRWCQANSFWKGNILSMAKLREKYDQLRLAAEHERNDRSGRKLTNAEIALQEMGGEFDGSSGNEDAAYRSISG